MAVNVLTTVLSQFPWSSEQTFGVEYLESIAFSFERTLSNTESPGPIL